MTAIHDPERDPLGVDRSPTRRRFPWGLAVASLAVVASGRYLAGEVRGLVRWETRADYSEAFAQRLAPWRERLPENAVILFEPVPDSPVLVKRLVQLRFDLAPRIVVLTGAADYAVLPLDGSESAGPEWEPLGSLGEGLVLCRPSSEPHDERDGRHPESAISSNTATPRS